MQYAYLLIQEQLQNREWVRRWFASVKKFPVPAFLLFEPFEDQVERIHFTAKRLSHYLSEQLVHAHYVMGHHHGFIREDASKRPEWHGAFLEPYFPAYQFLVIGNTYSSQEGEIGVLPLASLIRLVEHRYSPQWVLFPTLLRSPLSTEAHQIKNQEDLEIYLKAYPEEPVLRKMVHYHLFPCLIHPL